LVVTLVLVAGAIGTVSAAVRGEASRPAGAASAAVATPLWSMRRLPGPIVDPINEQRDAAAAAQLQHALDAEVGHYDSACFVVGRGANVLAARNADMQLIPASTQKLMTAAAALATLGADYRFETPVVAINPGAAIERLWFVGAGDPVIRTAQYMDEGVSTSLERLADAIVAQGVRRVGTVVGDDARYDNQRFLPSWNPSYLIDLDITPVGALTVTLGIEIVNGRPVVQDDPALFAAAELTRLLRMRGVAVGEPTRGVAPSDATRVAAVESQPLRTIVAWMLATSDNLTAEMLTKELGLRAGTGASTVSGVAAIQDTLRKLGVALSGEVMIDGSGLDRGNRTTCRILTDVIELGARPELRVLRDTLPGAARAAAGNEVRAKGGYLSNVTGLAGVVNRDPALRFAFIANGGVPKAANAELARFIGALVAQPAAQFVDDSLVPSPES
jgi:D-alanyl-D-alanine carboxypeptidase/D-alanyl-D-alanine-endopeptidase (penicillin-binding protein 4)